VRLAVIVTTSIVVLLGGSVSPARAEVRPSPAPTPRIHHQHSESCRDALRGIDWYRGATGRWAAQMDRSLRGAGLGQPRGCQAIRERAQFWKLRSAATRNAFVAWYALTYRKWECIHEHEGSWADDGYPYWGGLQMDMGFQVTFGSEFVRSFGTANRWPIWGQLIAAERAYRESGFSRWPNTRLMCGV
jgi:hypothetical protein